MRRLGFVVSLLSLSSMVGADSLWSGTWVLREPPQGGHLTMTVEEVGSGWKLTYKIVGPDAPGPNTSPVFLSRTAPGKAVVKRGVDESLLVSHRMV